MPLLYLAYVIHYSVNSLFGDDWNTVPVVHDALHGHLSVGMLWSQYAETRIVINRLVFIGFAYANRLDIRTIVVFNALLFIASYGVILALFHRYTGRVLTPLPVLLLGVTWFSLADVSTALWAFQVGWYLVVLCFLVAIYALLVPERLPVLWLIVAIVAAILGSLAFVQGFIIWPLGVVCILWTRKQVARPALRLVAWCLAGALLTGVYLVGFDRSQTGCIRSLGCVPGMAWSHPLQAARFLVLLLGNVLPGGYTQPIGSLIRFEVLGTLLLVASLAILVQTWRHRSTTDRYPVPAMLIVFALLFDGFIVVGRTGHGPQNAVQSNRYLLANLILLTGLVLYVLARLPRAAALRSGEPGRATAWISWMAVLLLIGIQVTVATDFGLRAAEFNSQNANGIARLVTNLDRIPSTVRTCELDFSLVPVSTIRPAQEDQLGEFAPEPYSYFRGLGPVPLAPPCMPRSVTSP